MPQSNPTKPQNAGTDKTPIQIAQGGEPHTDSPTDTAHTSTEVENKHPVGEIPDPVLLFKNAIAVAILLCVLGFLAGRKMKAIPTGIQALGEYVAEQLNGFTMGVIGPEGKKYTPFVGTIFLYIFLMNIWGVIPGLHSPTANISITLALGLVVFFYVEYESITARGIGGYIKHFAGPVPALAILLFPIEVISELIRPFTLAVRLFGNIFGEDVIIVALAGLLAMLGLKWAGFLPTHFPVLILSLLTAFVQAFVFAMLACVYLSLATSHDHSGEHGEHEEGQMQVV